MKEIVDALNANGQAISERELIAYIVDGLGVEYDPIIVHVYSRLDGLNSSITLAELKFLLQKFKQRLNRNNCLNLDVYGSTTNYANQVRYESQDSWKNQSDRNPEKFRNMNKNNADIVPSNVVNSDRAKRQNFQKLKVMCQVCRKPRHIALNCYHRFDVTYIGNLKVSSRVTSNIQQNNLNEIQKSTTALFISQAFIQTQGMS